MTSAEIRRNAANRSNYQMRLAKEWVRAHRPDILDKIREESFIKYPRSDELSGRRSRALTKTILPKGFDGKAWK